jgi:hypothetical protein
MRPWSLDALDRVPVELELADDYGGKVNPHRRATARASHRLLAGAAQSLEHPQLLSFNERHRPDSLPPFSRAHQHRVSHALAASATGNPTIAGSADPTGVPGAVCVYVAEQVGAAIVRGAGRLPGPSHDAL